MGLMEVTAEQTSSRWGTESWRYVKEEHCWITLCIPRTAPRWAVKLQWDWRWAPLWTDFLQKCVGSWVSLSCSGFWKSWGGGGRRHCLWRKTGGGAGREVGLPLPLSALSLWIYPPRPPPRVEVTNKGGPWGQSRSERLNCWQSADPAAGREGSDDELRTQGPAVEGWQDLQELGCCGGPPWRRPEIPLAGGAPGPEGAPQCDVGWGVVRGWVRVGWISSRPRQGSLLLYPRALPSLLSGDVGNVLSCPLVTHISPSFESPSSSNLFF